MSVPALTSREIMVPGVRHGFFGRQGGVSTGLYTSLNAGPGSGDSPESVAENRRRIAAAVGVSDPAKLLSLYQVHSPDVVTLSAPFGAERPKADGMVTDRPGLALCILTADCGPLLFVDAEAGVIGAAHAGWRGAVSGVAEATLDAMEALGARRERVQAALGPCIAVESYEVGEDYRDNILRDWTWAEFCFREGQTGTPHFDLKAYIAERLHRAGLSRLDVLPNDTYAEREAWHSHRRNTHDGLKDYGRNAAVIVFSET